MEDEAQDLRVLLFPWLAHGHISPFLELAKRLSHKGFHASICSTHVNLSSINDHLNRKAYPSIQLIEIQLPDLPDLPPQCHTTKSLPPHLMPTLKRAFDLSEPSFAAILKALKPDLVIYDFIQHWAPAAASGLNIPAVLFLPTGAAFMSFLLHHTLNPHEKFPFPSIDFTEKESQSAARRKELESNGIRDLDRVLECIKRSSSFICVKSFKEIESKYIDYLSIQVKKDVYPLGPLVQDPPQPPQQGYQCTFTEWLDKKERSSTVYVSFGSEYFMSKEEREEIARGLELSKVNFIWVLRFPEGEHMSLKQALPCGFLESVGERGMIVGWAPQARILDHPSIGGFVSHCGWSSVMEGMRFGVPLIAVPAHLDQPLNARLIVELGVGVEVKKGRHGEFQREELQREIKGVLVEKGGEVVRRKAKVMGEKMVNKGNDEIEVVVQKFRVLCAKRQVVKC